MAVNSSANIGLVSIFIAKIIDLEQTKEKNMVFMHRIPLLGGQLIDIYF